MPEPHHATLAQLRQLLVSRKLSARELAQALLDRIDELDRRGPALRSIIETNPDALQIAEALDRRSSDAGMLPLHGIPVLLKDSIDTADGLHTTAGSLGLLQSRPSTDAFVVERLRSAGAVILGKANMSEWANLRSTHSSSGWSARGGQGRNPYVLNRSPCGSSSGSASAVAAGLAPVSIGTETDGSILCPGAMNGVVGIKPTVGRTSRRGVVPISRSQDTIGSFGRTVEDAAVILGVIAGVDPRDPATAVAPDWPDALSDWLIGKDGLHGARLGVPRKGYFGYNPRADAIVEAGVRAMAQAGAEIVDPANIPSVEEPQSHDHEMEVLLYEFKDGMNEYLAGRDGDGPRTLGDLIRFNEEHAVEEMPYFGQEYFLMAQEKGDLHENAYLEALDSSRRLAREEGIDKVLDEHRLDALVMPTTSPAFLIDLINGDHWYGGSSGVAARAGYPAVTAPAGFVSELPVGITFVGRAFSEPSLLRLAHGFEALTEAWRPPRFLPTIGLEP